jgi:TATA-box binding protein (TBP) (component of TFIID and TFIIIB)
MLNLFKEKAESSDDLSCNLPGGAKYKDIKKKCVINSKKRFFDEEIKEEVKEPEDTINKILKMNSFENLKISTQTIIAITNFEFNINRLFDNLSVIEYNVVPKKRGRKKKDAVVQQPPVIKDGSIITLKYQNKIKGTNIKQKKANENEKYFRNSLTTVMFVDGKMLNFKISKNGKFQITGCKTVEQAQLCVKYLWEKIKNTENYQSFCEFKNNAKTPESIFKNVMTNVDTNTGFNINREYLDQYINKNTEYHSLLETSLSYTGVNIKIPLKKNVDLTLKKIQYNQESDTWDESEISYKTYYNSLIEKDKQKDNKKRYHTILVFHSGNIILSSMNIFYIKDLYQEFIKIITDCKESIEDK